MGVNQLVTETQAHKWYRQAFSDNGCWAKKKEEEDDDEEVKLPVNCEIYQTKVRVLSIV